MNTSALKVGPRLVALTAGIAIAVGTVLTLNLTGVLGQSGSAASDNAVAQAHGHSNDGISASSVSQGPGKPCADAEHFAAASDIKTDTKFWLEPSPFDDAWLCGSSPTPFVMYGNVQTSYSAGAATIPDAGEYIKDLVSRDGGQVGEVQGRPAWVRQGDAKASTYTHAMFVVNDTMVDMLAPADVSLAEVLKVADNLQLPAVQASPTPSPSSSPSVTAAQPSK